MYAHVVHLEPFHRARKWNVLFGSHSNQKTVWLKVGGMHHKAFPWNFYCLLPGISWLIICRKGIILKWIPRNVRWLDVIALYLESALMCNAFYGNRCAELTLSSRSLISCDHADSPMRADTALLCSVWDAIAAQTRLSDQKAVVRLHTSAWQKQKQADSL